MVNNNERIFYRMEKMLLTKKMFVSLAAIAVVFTGVNMGTVSAADDLSSFIAQKHAELEQAEKSMNQLGLDKGHDESAGQLLIQTAPKIDEAKAKLKELEEKKLQFDEAQSKFKGLELETKSLSRKIQNTLIMVTGSLKTVEGLIVGGPKNFPERCSIMTLDDPKGEARIQKAGFKKEKGIIEQFNRVWVLSVGDEKAPDALRRTPLDEKVGLIGSKDPNSGMLVKSLTPKDMFVTALVDPKTNKVMCVSKSQRVQ